VAKDIFTAVKPEFTMRWAYTSSTTAEDRPSIIMFSLYNLFALSEIFLSLFPIVQSPFIAKIILFYIS
jgi:hypothetical protein